jgi:hypothetical protein
LETPTFVAPRSDVAGVGGKNIARHTPSGSMSESWRKPMAKALLGHVGGHDTRVAMECRRLQQRVRDLESEVLRLQAENDALATSLAERMNDSDLISLEVAKQPALA